MQRSYLVISGKIVLVGDLVSESEEVFGYVQDGDSFGEEGIFDETFSAVRQETAKAEGDTYLFEILKENFEKMKDLLWKKQCGSDWFTLNNHMKNQWTTKRNWRLGKEEHQSNKTVKLF